MWAFFKLYLKSWCRIEIGFSNNNNNKNKNKKIKQEQNVFTSLLVCPPVSSRSTHISGVNNHVCNLDPLNVEDPSAALSLDYWTPAACIMRPPTLLGGTILEA